MASMHSIHSIHTYTNLVLIEAYILYLRAQIKTYLKQTINGTMYISFFSA